LRYRVRAPDADEPVAAGLKAEQPGQAAAVLAAAAPARLGALTIRLVPDRGKKIVSDVRTCAAGGCVEPVQVRGGASPYCVAHTGFVWDFHLWLAPDKFPGSAFRNFDARALWQRAAGLGTR
jgi:hypothetical protein